MAIRVIREIGDDILEKQCKAVPKMTLRTKILIGDMLETMYESNGVGLAAPQVGILRRVVLVIETNVEDEDDEEILELINPVIVFSEGEQTGAEGCLSVPGEYGIVTRPSIVTVRAQNRDGNWFEYTGTGLTARCICHELDHLDGHLFTEKCERMLSEDEIKGSGSEG